MNQIDTANTYRFISLSSLITTVYDIALTFEYECTPQTVIGNGIPEALR